MLVSPAAALTQAEFAALMAPLGPFERAPSLAAAVSGGADSVALAALAAVWVRGRGGSLLALIVDHGLRPESGREASETAGRLAARGIPARVLRLHALPRGSALAERARAARYELLRQACRAAGILHLLLGHQAADQAETVLMRRLSGSGPAGLAAMPALTEMQGIRLLRPLLVVPPARLRATLVEAGLAWAEDPSNADTATARARLRMVLAEPGSDGFATSMLGEAASVAGRHRAAGDAAHADILAGAACLRPEGFALVGAGSLPAAVLGALIQAVTGASYPPASAAVGRLAAGLHSATLAGARLVPAGEGFLVVREAAAIAPPIPAQPGVLWDRRFRLHASACVPALTSIGALGGDAAGLRRWSDLPAVVLRTLPALRCEGRLVAVPHLGFPDAATCAAMPVSFSPARPAAGAPWFAG